MNTMMFAEYRRNLTNFFSSSIKHFQRSLDMYYSTKSIASLNGVFSNSKVRVDCSSHFQLSKRLQNMISLELCMMNLNRSLCRMLKFFVEKNSLSFHTHILSIKERRTIDDAKQLNNMFDEKIEHIL